MPRFLVVIKPNRPTAVTRGQVQSWGEGPPVSATWVEAESPEDAAGKLTPVPGSDVYVVNEADVEKFHRPTTPALERV